MRKLKVFPQGDAVIDHGDSMVQWPRGGYGFMPSGHNQKILPDGSLQKNARQYYPPNAGLAEWLAGFAPGEHDFPDEEVERLRAETGAAIA